MRNAFQRIVVAGVDSSDRSLATVDFAAAEARLRGLPLRLVATHPDRTGEGPRTALTAVMRRVCTTWPGLPTTATNITGELAEELIDASRNASLVVVGRGQSSSVAAQVAAHSQCPTLVVPDDTPDSTTGPVLLGLSMTPEDEPAIAFAFEEAALRRVPVLAVHVWSGIPVAAVGTVSPFAYDLHRAQSAADQMLTAELAGWVDKYPDVTVDRMPLYDVNPAQTLLEASALAGLVVVGAHRRSLHGSQLLGTVARALIARATRPVVVVRPIHPR